MRGGVAVNGGKLVLRLSRLLPYVINCAYPDVNRALSFLAVWGQNMGFPL